MVKLMTRRSGALSYRLLATSLAYNDLEDDPNVARAKAIAFLPIVHGGLGLRSSELIAPAAHWAAWADILPTIASRRPAWIETVLTELERTGTRLHKIALSAKLLPVICPKMLRVESVLLLYFTPSNTLRLVDCSAL